MTVEAGWAVAWARTFAEAREIHDGLKLPLCDDIHDAYDKATFYAPMMPDRPKIFWVVRADA